MKKLMKPLAVAAMSQAMLAPAKADTKLPAQFVGEWCRIDGEDLHGTYLRARCPGERGLRFGIASYDFYTKARCTLTAVEVSGGKTHATFRCGLGKHDRDQEIANFSMSLNDKQQLVIE
jgi:hypothetical protein